MPIPENDPAEGASLIRRQQQVVRGEPDPKHRIERATAMPPPIPASIAPSSRTILAERAIYHALQVSSEPNANAFDKTFSVSGDHVYVAEIVGDSIYMRLGADSNPWIRCESQLEVTREFSKLRIKSAAGGFPPLPLASALLYVSTGPMFVRPPRMREGMSGSALCINGVADTSTFTLANYGASARPFPMFGKVGGVCVIKNTDVAATLILDFCLATVGGSFPLSPGESITFTMDQKLNLRPADIAPNQVLYPRMRAQAGTCAFTLLVSPSDYDDFDIKLGLNSHQLMG